MSPVAPGTPCPSPGCPAITPPGDYCDDHRSQRWDDDRPSFRERGYGTRWTKISRRYRRKHPLCEPCKEAGRTTAAEEVHHIDGDNTNHSHDNLMSVCRPCHRRVEKT